jgi:hypothetical protein
MHLTVGGVPDATPPAGDAQCQPTRRDLEGAKATRTDTPSLASISIKPMESVAATSRSQVRRPRSASDRTPRRWHASDGRAPMNSAPRSSASGGTQTRGTASSPGLEPWRAECPHPQGLRDRVTRPRAHTARHVPARKEGRETAATAWVADGPRAGQRRRASAGLTGLPKRRRPAQRETKRDSQATPGLLRWPRGNGRRSSSPVPADSSGAPAHSFAPPRQSNGLWSDACGPGCGRAGDRWTDGGLRCHWAV